MRQPAGFNRNEIYDYLINNEAVFIFSLKNNMVSKIIFRDEVIVENKTIEELLENDSRFIIDNEAYEVVKNFVADFYESGAKKRICIKMQFSKGKNDWYLFESFEHNIKDELVYGTIKNVADILKDRDELVVLSEQDSMTGLFNKAYIEKYINNLSKTSKNQFAIVVVLDIDYFKNINDRYGHNFGDKVLKQASTKLKRFIGENGVVGRAGGDEFLIVRDFDHDPQLEEIKKFARELRSLFEDLSFSEVDDFYCTETCGIVIYPKDGTDFSTLFEKADKALYRGKRKGRDCYIIYHDQLHRNINVREAVSEIANDTNINFSPISGSEFIGQILDYLLYSDNIFDSIDDVLTDIGKFFNLDRILFARKENGKFKIKSQWYKLPEYYLEEFYDIKDLDKYRSLFDNDGIFIVNNIFSPRSSEMELVKMIYHQKPHGSLVQTAHFVKGEEFIFSYEMCPNRRLWQRQEIIYFKTISKVLFSFLLKFYKENLKDVR